MKLAKYGWSSKNNGKIMFAKNIKIPVYSQAVQYGLGCFEGIKFYKTKKGPAIFRFQEHLKRFRYSMETLKMFSPFSDKRLGEAIITLIKKNKIEEGYIRPWAGYTEEKIGIPTNPSGISIAFFIADWPSYFDKPLRLMTAGTIRPHPNSLNMQAKICGHYVNSWLAKQEALHLGFDDALMLDKDGDIAEATVANVFVCWKNRYRKKVITTSSSKSILLGITRNSVVTILKNKGYIVSDLGIITQELLYKHGEINPNLKEIFICGTASEIMPVISVNDLAINNGQPGAITKMLQKIYKKIVHGEIPKYEHWLTYVN